MRRISTVFAAFLVVAMAATAPAVVINEFLYTSEGGNAYIELYNRTIWNGHPSLYKEVDIAGWKVQFVEADQPPRDLFTIDDSTSKVLYPGDFYLIATQDVFVAMPDLETSFTVYGGSDAVVRGLALIDTSLGVDVTTDTLLYSSNPATASFGTTETLYDDANKALASRVIDTTAVPLGGSGGATTINTDSLMGSGLRRRFQVGSEAEGDGADSNDSALDFIGFAPGGGSPRAYQTPVTLSIFEAK
jgi:hypothetical protein